MNSAKTERGFALIEFVDFNEVPCSLQKSSIATADCIWLGCNDIGLKEFVAYRRPSAWVDVHLDQTMEHCYIANNRMHLTRKQVSELLPALQHFADTVDLP